MFTLDQLVAASSVLEASLQTLSNFHSLSIYNVTNTHVYYTDGEARGAIATTQIGRKNPNHIPGRLDKPAVQYCNLYIFPDGRVMSHFMQRDESYKNTSEYVTFVKNWLTTMNES